MLPFSQRIFKALIPFLPVILVVLTPVGAGAADVTPVGVVLASRLNVRSGPGIRHPVKAVLESGTQITVLGKTGGWLEVRHQKTYGYVRALPEYVRLISAGFKGKPDKMRIRLLEEKTSAIEQDLRKRKNKVRDLSGKEADVLSDLDRTQRALNRMKQRQLRSLAQLTRLERSIDSLENRSEMLSEEVASIRVRALKRLAALYKLSQMGTFHFLISARSVHEYLYMEEGFRRILAQDEAVLSTLAEKREALRRTLNDVMRRKREKQRLERTYREQLQTMAVEKAKRSALLRTLRSQKTLQLAAIKDLRRSARRLEGVLEDLRRRAARTKSTEQKGGSFSAMKGLLTLPVEGKITGKFGTYETSRLHMKARRNGIEIETEEGAPIKAVFDGKVVYSDWFRGYGNLIIIDHGEGFYTVYAHALERFKADEERVEAGEVIATAGESGRLGRAVLYFEIRRHEKPVDPLSWLRKE